MHSFKITKKKYSLAIFFYLNKLDPQIHCNFLFFEKKLYFMWGVILTF